MILSTLKIEQLLQLEYIAILLDWMKPGCLSANVFFPLAIMQVLFSFPEKVNYKLKNNTDLCLITGSSELQNERWHMLFTLKAKVSNKI